MSKGLKVTSPRGAKAVSKATIKRNSDTWDSNKFESSRPSISEDAVWARLVSTNNSYDNVNVSKDEVIFGRRDDADVAFLDGAISGTHCRIFREKAEDAEDDDDFEVWLEDTSTNGTFVKDKRVGKGNKVQIQSGTEIVLIPRGKDRTKVSFVLYVLNQERQEVAPEGTVTVVFTDVQSSTQLWEAAANSMDSALKKHDKILRKLLKKYRGYEVKTEGDAFFVAFFSTLDAMLWCLAVQKALCQASWPAPILEHPSARIDKDNNGKIIFAGIRVRMGIHTGVPNCRRNPVTARMDYFGPVVNRAARISDSAHGGQIVITEEVQAAYMAAKSDPGFVDKFPVEVLIKSVGTYMYKGIADPIPVFQILSPDFEGRQFPELRSDDSLRQQRKHTRLFSPEDEKGNGVTVCSNPDCSNIEKPGRPFGACARCKQVRYCSPQCQKDHWTVHKKPCKKVGKMLKEKESKASA